MRIRHLLALVLGTSTASAGFLPSPGYHAEELASTAGTFTLIEGGFLDSGHLVFGRGTAVQRIDLETLDIETLGTVPANVSFGDVARVSNRWVVAYGESWSFPYPSRIGILDEAGDFINQAGMDGIYDFAVDPQGNLYVAANPGNLGARILRYDPVGVVFTEVANVGGWSGGITFDPQGRLYVAAFSPSQLLRYSPTQLAGGGLTRGHAEVFASASASYMASDDFGHLYVVQNSGNELVQYDQTTKELLDVLAEDDSIGYGIGSITWRPWDHTLLVAYADFNSYDSTLYRLHLPGPFGGNDSGIAGTSSVFRGWITEVVSFTHPTNSGGFSRDSLSDPLPRFDPSSVLGFPGGFDLGAEGSTAHVLSLGNGGEIIVSFGDAIANRPGPDFAVFENGFTDAYRTGEVDYTFAELAYVEVGTTTSAWARFPSVYLGTNVIYNFPDPDHEDRVASQDVTLIEGLAGKHRLAYGTPFDLSRLVDHPNVVNGSVDLNYIRYVKIIDIPGDGSRVDSSGRPIYDPYYSSLQGYPTPAPLTTTDGFDLRGVGVLHFAGADAVLDEGAPGIRFYGEGGVTYQVVRTLDGTPVGSQRIGTNGWDVVMDHAPSAPSAWYHVEQVP